MPQWEYLIVTFDLDQDRPRYTKITSVAPAHDPPDASPGLPSLLQQKAPSPRCLSWLRPIVARDHAAEAGEEIPNWQTRDRLALFNEWSAQGWRLHGDIPPPAPGRQLHYRRPTT